MVLALALALVAAAPSPQVAARPGIYVPDLSGAHDRSGALKAVFGWTRLCLQSDGTFHFAAIRQQGFWRMHEGRVVLVLDGFFDKPFPIPDAVLKRSWPENHLEGYVLSVQKDGTLVLPAMGQVKGPVLFRREADRSTHDLIRTSNAYEPGTEDEKEAIGEAAYHALSDRIRSRLQEALDAIEDPRVPVGERGWVAIMLEGNLSPADAPELRRTMETVLEEGLPQREAARLGRPLGRALAGIADKGSIPTMMRAMAEKRVSTYDVPRAYASAGYREGEPQLVAWLAHESEWVREEACKALGALGLDAELLRLRELALNDPEGQVRIAAWAAVSELSPDPLEQDRAIDALGGLYGKTLYHDRDILEAWGASRSKRAMAHLVHILEGDFDPSDRAKAASLLAKQGLPEAVSSLMAMKSRKPPGPPPNRPPTEREVLVGEFERAIGFWAVNAGLDKAVAEALWAFDERARLRSARDRTSRSEQRAR